MAASSSTSPNEATQAQATLRQSGRTSRRGASRRLIDAEVRRIVEAAYDEVPALLREHRDQLDALADRLIERETLDEADAYATAGIDHPDSEGALPSRGKE